MVRSEPGEVVRFVNDSATVLSLEDLAGGWTVSPVPPGGGAAIALNEGSYQYRDISSGATGRILVGAFTLESLGAAPDDLIEAHIPDLWFPAEDSSQRPYDPAYGMHVSTSRLLVAFGAGTTVAEAQGVLDRAGAVFVGGMASSGILLALVAGGADHGVLHAALDQIRAEPTVEAAAADKDYGTSSLPPVNPAGVAADCIGPCPTESSYTGRFTDAGFPLGQHITTWGHEATRLPQAWNLAGVADATGERITTAVLELGFSLPHQDLPSFGVESVCLGSGCSGTTGGGDGVHGNHVAGILGAAHEAPGVGVAGADPGADMVGVLWRELGPLGTLEAVLNARAAGTGRLADLRVVNMSIGPNLTLKGAETWAGDHTELACGPGRDDDAGGTGPCLPWTHDATIDAYRADAELGRRVVERAAGLGVTVVHSAGNSGRSWCVEGGELKGSVEVGWHVGSVVIIPDRARPASCARQVGADAAIYNTEVVGASFLLDEEGAANPVVVVESIGTLYPNGPDQKAVATASVQRSEFSQTGGTISAPGLAVSASVVEAGRSRYQFLHGTSMAAPLVAGIVSYLLRLDPSIEATEVARRLATFADATDPDPASQPSPRVDAFGSVLGLPGALEAILDVDDGTVDGNRRVELGPGGAPLGAVTSRAEAEPLTATRTIDERDFRVFRDAWLQICHDDPDAPDCEAPRDIGIALDGTADHPKFDLNGDGCRATVPSTSSCPTPEHVYPRVDFNGDGNISLSDTHPVEVDGATVELTDLGVLARRFVASVPGIGWTPVGAESLEGVLVDRLLTGDVTVHTGGLKDAGATDLTVELRRSGTAPDDEPDWEHPLLVQDLAPVLSIPAGEPVEVMVRARRDGEEIAYGRTFELLVGQDVRYDPCGVIDLVAADPSVAFDGITDVVAQVRPCEAVDMSTVEVDFEVTRAGAPTSGATVAAETLTVDDDGRATNAFTATDEPGLYLVTARSALASSVGPVLLESTVPIRVDNGYGLEILASGEEWSLGMYPSIAPDDGDVVWTTTSWPGAAEAAYLQWFNNGLSVATHDGVFRSDGATTTPMGLPEGTEIRVGVEAAAGNRAFVHGVNVDSSGVVLDQDIQLEVTERGDHRTPVVLESKLARLFDQSPIEGFPTANAAGDVLVPFGYGLPRLGSYVSSYGSGTIVGGPYFVANPRLADDGTTVGLTDVDLASTSGNVSLGAIVTGEGNLQGGATPVAIRGQGHGPLGPGTWPAACDEYSRLDGFDGCRSFPTLTTPWPGGRDPSGWYELGKAPDISATGDVVAFVGDRGQGPSVYIAVRLADGSYSDPVAVGGPARDGGRLDDGAYLQIRGERPQRDRRRMFDFPVGVTHVPAGPAGYTGDRVVVAFGAERWPTPFQPDYTDPQVWAPGLYTVDITLAAGGAPVLGEVRPVIEAGDVVEGSPVTEINWHRVLSPAGSDLDPDSTPLGFWVRTESGAEHIVRARLRTEAPVAGQGRSFPSAPALPPSAGFGGSVARLATAGLQADPPSADLPASLIVSDLTPEVGDEVLVSWSMPDRPGSRCWSLTLDGVEQAANPGSSYTCIERNGQRTLSLPDPGTIPLVLATEDGHRIGLDLAVDLPEPSDPIGSPPVADAGGPYAITAGDSVVFSAAASTDVEGPVRWARWDLDGDGAFDDAEGLIVPLLYNDDHTTNHVVEPNVRQLVCGGTCADGVAYPIGARVYDEDGNATTATTTLTVEIIPTDFSLGIIPGSQLVNPGEKATYLVEVGSIGGFEDPVTLTVDPLPEGYTTRWGQGRSTVRPPASALLEIVPPATAQDTGVPIDIVVRGQSGTLVHDTSATAEVTFGLIPVCYGSMTGAILDRSTGEPIADASVQVSRAGTPFTSATTDADGRYAFEELEPHARLSLRASASGYHSRAIPEQPLGCGEVIDDTFRLPKVRTVVVTGRVTVGVPDPANLGANREVVPTETPVAGARLLQGNAELAVTDAEGYYRFEAPLGGNEGDPARFSFSIRAEGYWFRSSGSMSVPDGPPAVLDDIGVVPICTGRVGAVGRITFPDGTPAPGRTVEIVPVSHSGALLSLPVLGPWVATTDADGRYEIPLAAHYLDVQNSQRAIGVRHRHPDDRETYGMSSSFRGFVISPTPTRYLERCDEDRLLVFDGELPELPIERVDVSATVSGRLVDAETGEPLAGGPAALLSPTGSVRARMTAGPDGRFTSPEVDIGTYDSDPALAPPVLVESFAFEVEERVAEGYRSVRLGLISLPEGHTDLGDIAVPRVVWAGVRGRVTDAVTGEPIVGQPVDAGAVRSTGVRVGCGESEPGAVVTDDEGYYAYHCVGRDRPGPFSVNVTVVADDGWYMVQDTWFSERVDNVQVVPGEVVEQDFALVRRCASGTIRGTVIDGLTRLPILEAQVKVLGDQVDLGATTGEDGRFSIGPIEVGHGNEPRFVTVRASADGYVTQERRVSVFCGADIVVNFGASTGAGDVYGTAVDGDGQPIRDVYIGSEPGAWASTSSTGAYRLEDLPVEGVDGAPTDWVITALHPDGRRLEQTATVTNGGETRVDFVFDDTVPSDRPPVIDPLADVTLAEGDTTSVEISATDPDGDPITLSATGLPAWAELVDDGDGTGRIVLAPDDDGTATVTVRACASGACDETTFTVTVTNVAPTVTASADDPVPWGVDVELTAEAGDPSTVDAAALTYRWDLDGDGTFELDGGLDPSTTTRYPAPGTHPARVQVCDDHACTEAPVEVEVTRRPVLLDQVTGADVHYSDRTTVSARLRDGVDQIGLGALDISFAAGGAAADAVTSGAGVAQVELAIEVPAGPLAVTASFAGTDLYDPGSASGSINVGPEEAVLVWDAAALAPAVGEPELRVAVTQADDGHPGDLALAAVTFLLSPRPDCTESLTVVGPVPVVPAGPGALDGVAATPAPDLTGTACVLATLTDPDDPDGTNAHYVATPAPTVLAGVVVLLDTVVVGGTADPGDITVEIRDVDGVYATATDADPALCGSVDLDDPEALDGLPCAVALVGPGAYTVGAADVDGYVVEEVACTALPASGGGDGDPSSGFTAPDEPGAAIHCTVTLGYRDGRVLVTRTVANPHGGTAGPEQWTVTIHDSAGRPVVTQRCASDGACLDARLPIGTYEMREDGPEGYETTLAIVVGPETDGVTRAARAGDDPRFALDGGQLVTITASTVQLAEQTTPPTTASTTTTSTTTTPTTAPSTSTTPTTAGSVGTTGAAVTPTAPLATDPAPGSVSPGALPRTGASGPTGAVLAAALALILAGSGLAALARRRLRSRSVG